MKNGTRWVILDTETDGLYDPIHIVELSGQLMEGWQPIGDPFSLLLNHEISIPEEAVAIHGYTREFLRENGHNPVSVHEAFREYARDYPVVAHNLSYDWNRCLEPEWARLGISPIGCRGFCSMMLSRRLVPETKSYRLQVLKELFNLTPTQSHKALNDTLTVVELFQKVYQPRLEAAGLNTFESVFEFAKKTPVAKCREMICGGGTSSATRRRHKDAWYYIDATNQDHGPMPAREVIERTGTEVFYVWREGMDDWAINAECSEFGKLAKKSPPKRKPVPKSNMSKTNVELVGLCKGLIADDKITTPEVRFLNSWLEDAGCINEWPASEIAQLLERILEDGKVTKEEKGDLKSLLEAVTSHEATPSSVSSEPETSVFSGTEHCSVVQHEQGTREWLEWRHKGIGASDAPVVMGENPWKMTDALLRDKCGQLKESYQNPAMARGTQLEPEARRAYIEKTGNQVSPACLQSNQYGWLRASVDGISADGGSAVEIKCGDSAYRKTAEYGSPPDYYYGQLQHIIAVAGLAAIDFWCYLPDRPGILVRVDRDDDYIERMVLAEYEFWGQVQQAESS